VLGKKPVSVGEEAFVLFPKTVAVVFEPGSIRFAQLAQQVGDELALVGELRGPAAAGGRRGVQRICCLLTIRLLITCSTADSASELEMTSPAP